MAKYEVTLGVDMLIHADDPHAAVKKAQSLLYEKLGAHGIYSRDHLIGSWSHHAVWDGVLDDIMETKGVRIYTEGGVEEDPE